VGRLLLRQVAPNVSSGVVQRLSLQALALHSGAEFQTLLDQLLDTVRQGTRAVLNIRPKVVAPKWILPDCPFQRPEPEIETRQSLLCVGQAQSLSVVRQQARHGNKSDGRLRVEDV
jgi:hypothetical protein